MTDNIGIAADGRHTFAAAGNREDVWHRFGQYNMDGKSMDEWLDAAGLLWTAIKSQARLDLDPAQWPHLTEAQRRAVVESRHHIVRSDNGYPLGFGSDQFQCVQPRELAEFTERFVAVDDNFAFDVMGALFSGETIWCGATYRKGLTVAGESHRARLLTSTAFDGSAATRAQITTTRGVCNNTLNICWGDKRAMIRVRHNTKFDPAVVAKQLAQLAQSVTTFKEIGDAMATVELTREETARFFKALLKIDPEAKADDISTRKQNQFADLTAALDRTTMERNGEAPTVWTALQSVTRYVDHDRSTRSGRTNDESESRFASANFGSGDSLKGEAMQILLPRVKHLVRVAA